MELMVRGPLRVSCTRRETKKLGPATTANLKGEIFYTHVLTCMITIYICMWGMCLCVSQHNWMVSDIKYWLGQTVSNIKFMDSSKYQGNT